MELLTILKRSMSTLNRFISWHTLHYLHASCEGWQQPGSPTWTFKDKEINAMGVCVEDSLITYSATDAQSPTSAELARHLQIQERVHCLQTIPSNPFAAWDDIEIKTRCKEKNVGTYKSIQQRCETDLANSHHKIPSLCAMKSLRNKYELLHTGVDAPSNP